MWQVLFFMVYLKLYFILAGNELTITMCTPAVKAVYLVSTWPTAFFQP